MNIQEFLARQNVMFEVIEHDPTYDAQRLAQDLHVSGKHVAKTVLVRTDAGCVVAVLPASYRISVTDSRERLPAPMALVAWSHLRRLMAQPTQLKMS